MKRIITMLLAISLLFTGTTAFAKDEPSDWSKEQVGEAIRENLVPDVLQKNYQQPISRKDVAQMIINLIEKTSGQNIVSFLKEKDVTIDDRVFTDTTDYAVLAANALGIISGVGNNRFDSDGILTRGQIAAIINRTAQVFGAKTDNILHDFSDVSGNWVDSELGWAYRAGIINGVGNGMFDPDGTLTVEQTIVLVDRALKSFNYNLPNKIINEGNKTETYNKFAKPLFGQDENERGITKVMIFYNLFGESNGGGVCVQYDSNGRIRYNAVKTGENKELGHLVISENISNTYFYNDDDSNKKSYYIKTGTDLNSNLITTDVYLMSGEKIVAKYIQYDDNGNKIKEYIYCCDELYYSCDYLYDEYGNEISKNEWEKTDNLESKLGSAYNLTNDRWSLNDFNFFD